MSEDVKPRQIISWVELQCDCPLPESECGVKKGESQKDHEEYCNEHLDYNFIRSSCIAGEYYENLKAGDTIKFIEIEPTLQLMKEMGEAFNKINEAKKMFMQFRDAMYVEVIDKETKEVLEKYRKFLELIHEKN